MTFQYDVAGPAVPVRAADTTGERRLMIATLHDALRTLLGMRYGSRHPKAEREDLEWLTSDDTSHPFTYARICDALGIDAGWLRSRVLAARGPSVELRPPSTHDFPLHAERAVAQLGR